MGSARELLVLTVETSRKKAHIHSDSKGFIMTVVQGLERKGIETKTDVQSTLMPELKARFDDAIVRYDAWFIVFVAVILALGATLLAGMAVWCVTNQKGKFTGHWKWENGVSVSMECA